MCGDAREGSAFARRRFPRCSLHTVMPWGCSPEWGGAASPAGTGGDSSAVRGGPALAAASSSRMRARIKSAVSGSSRASSASGALIFVH